MSQPNKNSLAPWLEIPDGPRALNFYKSAFDAEETYRYDSPDGGFVVRLNANGAEFWLSFEGPKTGDAAASAKPNTPAPLGGENLRLILTVPDPDATFAKAIAAGATQVYAVSDGHGWRIGRLIDPFGLHWEIGRPL
ncbi:MAG: VOC family protein [Acidobacteria bacterium]|nr:VOC family protein [Acidobacteriota bacterium]